MKNLQKQIDELEKRIITLKGKYLKSKSRDDVGDNILYDEIKNFVIKKQRVSTSYIQRAFNIGYSRAKRIIVS